MLYTMGTSLGYIASRSCVCSPRRISIMRAGHIFCGRTHLRVVRVNGSSSDITTVNCSLCSKCLRLFITTLGVSSSDDEIGPDKICQLQIIDNRVAVVRFLRRTDATHILDWPRHTARAALDTNHAESERRSNFLYCLRIRHAGSLGSARFQLSKEKTRPLAAQVASLTLAVAIGPLRTQCCGKFL